MTKEQLREMFLAQEAWDRDIQDKDLLARLTEALSALNDNLVRLNELLKA